MSVSLSVLPERGCAHRLYADVDAHAPTGSADGIGQHMSFW